ncbi:uncharacterized protein LOC132980558 [Labrus mixtus]|uniref:uncharacterized protein LOC132980558 n=1 Tax=Labrus mixtus TaxID=508554 RepID=UPI0029C09C3D|nr:uncharacterized protein LOC132980558 [Labrus mixtus]
MVSYSTCLRWDQCTEVGQYGHEEPKHFISSATCKNAVIHDQTKLTQTCASVIYGCMNMLQRLKKTENGDMQKTHFCKCKIQQLLLYSLSRRNSIQVLTEMDNSKHWNYSNICASSGHLKSEAPHSQSPSTLYATHSPKEDYLTQADDIECNRMEILQPTESTTWVARFFLAAVLVVGIHIRRLNISPNRVSPAHANTSTVMMLFSMTLHSFSPSAAINQPSEWSRNGIGISFVISLSCALGKTLQVIIACRTAFSVIKLCGNTHQQFRAVPTIVSCMWLTVGALVVNKCVKTWFEDLPFEGSVGSTLKCWSVIGQVEQFATLFYAFVSLSSLLKSVLINIHVLIVLLNVQLLNCLRISMVPTKYVLVIRISTLV